MTVQHREHTRRLVFISMLAAFGLVMFVFESFLPVLPWFRPGFGNVATLLALMLFGFSDGLKVTILRIGLGALVLGRLFTPIFLFAAAGGIASVVVMALAMRIPGKPFGPVGISIIGAVVHNEVQLAVAYFFVMSGGIYILLPVFIVTGVVTGAVVGFVASLVADAVGQRFPIIRES